MEEECIDEYIKNIKIIDISVSNKFVGDNIYITFIDNNKKVFKKKTVSERILCTNYEDYLDRYARSAIREYAYKACKDKIFEEKKQAILDKYKED